MRLTFANFRGQIPRLHPRLLPDSHAQLARNLRFEDGALAPLRGVKTVHTFPSAVSTIYLHNGVWLGWTGFVNAAPGPVAQDRLYYTGDGAPKVRIGTTVYNLAVPAPAAAPTTVNLSSAGTTNLETVVYVYTYVTSFDEESAPSPASALLTTSLATNVRVRGFSAAPSGRSIDRMRIYRSKTSAAGVTDLYFVAEVAASTTQYDHNPNTAPIQEPLRSASYDVPRTTLNGLVSMPNGMMAAFDGKELFFCEPFIPHAWPQEYALMLDSPIVGLAVFGSTLVVLTNRNPYIVQGTHPSNMVMEKVDQDLPCLSRRGIVDTGYAALFPTTDGLAMVSASNTQILTRQLFTSKQWALTSPDSFVAGNYDGRYLFTYTFSQFNAYDGGAHDTTYTDTLDGGTHQPPATNVLTLDFGQADSAFGEQRIGMIDASGEAPFFSDSDIALPQYIFKDPITGRIYMLIGGVSVVEWDSDAAPVSDFIWRSKLIQPPFPTNFGCMQIDTDEELTSDNHLTCTVYADDRPVHAFSKVNEPQRLPSGFLSRRWEVEVTGNMTTSLIALANEMSEIAG